MYKDFLDSFAGILQICADDKKIISIEFVQSPAPKNPNHLTQNALFQLSQYFEGKRVAFDLPIFFEDNFTQNIWRELVKIPFGKTQSYRQIAQKMGDPKKARAVGNAVGKNPFAIVVPCHRVIKSDGKIGGFGWGVETKKKLLDFENKLNT